MEVSQAILAQFVGLEAAQINVATGNLSQLPAEHTPTAPDTSANPTTIEQNAAIEQARAELQVLERSYFPRFYLQGAAYARGSGAETSGERLGGLNGLAPNFQNYALGLTVTFPISDLPSVRAREAEQTARIRTETARFDQIAVDLKAQWNRAVAAMNAARRIAGNTPTEIAAAHAAVQQATARYQSGLGNIDDLAEAQRLLAQAEVDDVLARLGVWRGLLGIASAAGDIQPFVAEANR